MNIKYLNIKKSAYYMNESTKLQNSIDRLRKRLILIVALFFIFVSLLLLKNINDSRKKSLIDYHLSTQESFKRGI